jgi:hypothetical protein
MARRYRWWREPLQRVTIALAPAVLSAALRVLKWTVRLEIVNADALFGRWARGERVIVVFWHSRLLMMPIAAHGHPVCIMNSEHRDGEIATRAAARWGIRSVRGSATRGGVKGFLQLVRAYRDGWSLAVVPDGPRGPAGVAKPGVVHLAKATKAPIVPVSYAASRCRQLRSWDRLIIPLPFSRVVLVIGDALAIPETADGEELERQRMLLEGRLHELGRAAEARLTSRV